MAIRFETIVNAPHNVVRAFCPNCNTGLGVENQGLTEISKLAVDLMKSRAQRHARKYVNHQPVVRLYKRLLTDEELRNC